MKESKKDLIVLISIAIIVLGVILGVVLLTQNWGKTKDDINTEQAIKQLNKLYSGLKVRTLTPTKDAEYVGNENYTVLPDISTGLLRPAGFRYARNTSGTRFLREASFPYGTWC